MESRTVTVDREVQTANGTANVASVGQLLHWGVITQGQMGITTAAVIELESGEVIMALPERIRFSNPVKAVTPSISTKASK
jgi:hypothetical protein